jgi:peroxiredoxin Q/BCP
MAAKGARATAGKMSKKGTAQAAKVEAKAAPKAPAKAAPKKAAAAKAKAKAKAPLSSKAASAPKGAKAKPLGASASAKKAPAKAAKPTPPKAPPSKSVASKPARVAAPKAAKPAPAPKAAPNKTRAPNAAVAKQAAAAKAQAAKAVAPKAAAKKPVKAVKANGDAEPASSSLSVGDSVPDVEVVDHDGNAFSLGSLKGESYVLYFYPKDDTPGCTREACAFRDDQGKYDGAKVRVIGVSPDKPESHVRFRDKYGLSFTLLSDADKAAANAFGVWKKKQNYGREYMGIERTTFLVDENGKVKKVWRNVKVDGHSQSILDAAS